eukprot:TRINITY_DN3403_c0_g1_i1.p1 TRINITY_DN3403_c0_g1~~TRINITY_DN3403_c0_g1_i1.p1  ORF type:complete len:2491 (-),score=582.43 TRINITY_DN3403_c0_g1_i1:25-7497(-)
MSLVVKNRDGVVLFSEEHNAILCVDWANPQKPLYLHAAGDDFPAFFKQSCVFYIVNQQLLEDSPELIFGHTVELQHHSGAFLSGEGGKVSEKDARCFKASLRSNNGPWSQFRLLPRLKQRSEGEKLFVGDQVLLQNPVSLQFLHVSRVGGAKQLEVNFSSSFSGVWRIQRFVEHLSEVKTAVRGGDVCRLFHNETECDLVAQTAFDGENKDGAATQNKARLGLHSDRIDTRSPAPSTAIWEIVQPSWEGAPLLWGDSTFRLKHIATGLFLSSPLSSPQNGGGDEGIPMQLTPQGTAQNAIFKFFPTTKAEGSIRYSSLVRIFHPATKTWLHVASKISHTAPMLSREKKFSIKTVLEQPEVIGRRNLSDDDSFTILPVAEPHQNCSQTETEDLVILCTKKARLVEFLGQLQNTSTVFQPSDLAPIFDTLSSLNRFLFNTEWDPKDLDLDGTIIPYHQGILREQQLWNILLILLVKVVDRFPQYFQETDRTETLGHTASKSDKGLVIFGANAGNETVQEKFVQIVQFALVVLANSVRGNPSAGTALFHLSKPVISKLFDFPFLVSMYVRRLIGATFNDNISLLREHSTELIERGLRTLAQSKRGHPNNLSIIEMFTSLCQCRGAGFAPNQDMVAVAFESSSALTRLLFPITIENGVFTVEPEEGAPQPFSPWYWSMTFASLPRKFVNAQQLFLVAIARDRRESGLRFARKILAFDVALGLAETAEIHPTFRAAAVDVLGALYVHCPPQITRPDALVVRPSSEISGTMRRARQTASSSTLQRIRSFLDTFVGNSKQLCMTTTSLSDGYKYWLQLASFIFSANVLALVRAMVLYGVYDAPGDLLQLQASLRVLLHDSSPRNRGPESPLDPDAMYRSGKVTSAFQNCKAEVCKILQATYVVQIQQYTRSKLVGGVSTPEAQGDGLLFACGSELAEKTRMELLELVLYDSPPLVSVALETLVALHSMREQVDIASSKVAVVLVDEEDAAEKFLAAVTDLQRIFQAATIDADAAIESLGVLISLADSKHSSMALGMFRSLRAHLPIYGFLSQNRLSEMNPAMRKLVKRCYDYLAAFSAASSNRTILSTFVPLLVEHLASDLEPQLPATIRAILRNNSFALRNIDNMLVEIASQLSNVVPVTSKTAASACLYLELMEATLVCEETPIRANQEAVLDILFSNTGFVELLQASPEESVVVKLSQALQDPEAKPSLHFYVALVNLLATTSVGRYRRAESICMSSISLSECIQGAVQSATNSESVLSKQVLSAFLRFATEVYFVRSEATDDVEAISVAQSHAALEAKYIALMGIIGREMVLATAQLRSSHGVLEDAICDFLLTLLRFLRTFLRFFIEQAASSRPASGRAVLSPAVRAEMQKVIVEPLAHLYRASNAASGGSSSGVADVSRNAAVVISELLTSGLDSDGALLAITKSPEKEAEREQEAAQTQGAAGRLLGSFRGKRTVATEMQQLIPKIFQSDSGPTPEQLLRELRERSNNSATQKTSSEQLPSSSALSQEQTQLAEVMARLISSSESTFGTINDMEFVRKFVAQLKASGGNKSADTQHAYMKFFEVLQSVAVQGDPGALQARQLKLSEAGCVDLVVFLVISSADQAVENAALRLGTELLSGGNQIVQSQFLTAIRSNLGGSQFLVRLRESMRALTADVNSSDVVQAERTSNSLLLTSLDRLNTILLFLQQLCEGHNSDSQTFVRAQPGKESVDLVSECANLLSVVDTVVVRTLISLNALKRQTGEKGLETASLMTIPLMGLCQTIFQLFQTLCEFCQGPVVGNQIALVSGKVCPSSLTLFAFVFFLQKQIVAGLPGMLSTQLKQATQFIALLQDCKIAMMAFLQSLLEAQDDKTVLDTVAQQINQSDFAIHPSSRLLQLDSFVDIVLALLLESCSESNQHSDKFRLPSFSGSSFERYAKLGETEKAVAVERDFEISVQLYIFLHSLYDVRQHMFPQQLLPLFLYTREASMEKPPQFLLRKDHTEKNIYPYPAVRKVFQRQTAHIEIVRNTRIESVYFRKPQKFIEYIDSPPVRNFRDVYMYAEVREGPLPKLDSLLAVHHPLNLLLENQTWLANLKNEPHLSSKVMYGIANNSHHLQRVALCLTVLINILILSFFTATPGTTRMNALLIEHSQSLGLRIIGLAHLAVGMLLLVASILNAGRLKWMDAAENENATKIEMAWSVVKTPELMFRIIYLLLSLLGVAISPFFFTLHLVDVAGESLLLRKTLSGLVHVWRHLGVVIGLGVVMLYLFSTIGFLFYRNRYTLQDQDACDSFLECFIQHVDYGMRTPPIWNQNYFESQRTDGGWFGPFLLDFVYNILIVLVLTSMISGIIIDLFAEMRNTKDTIDRDKRGRCYICGIESEQFEHHGLDFEEHINRDHNMWLYVAFLIHLGSKNEREFTAQESFVANQVGGSVPSIKWFPIRSSRRLQMLALEEEGEAAQAAAIQRLQQQVTELRAEFKEMGTLLKHAIAAPAGKDAKIRMFTSSAAFEFE